MTSLFNKCFNIVAIAVIALSVSIGAASATSKNIVETAVQSGKFNTLVAALKAAGLVNTLNGKQSKAGVDFDLPRYSGKDNVWGYSGQENKR